MIPKKIDSMTLFVAKHYHDYIRNHDRINGELKRSLKNHPKSDEIVANLSEQFRHVQDVRLKTGKKKISDMTLISAIRDFAEILVKGIEVEADKRIASELEKYMREHALDDEKDMQSTLEGKSTGAFEDMGLEIPEEQQVQTENHIKEPIPEGRVISIGKG